MQVDVCGVILTLLGSLLGGFPTRSFKNQLLDCINLERTCNDYVIVSCVYTYTYVYTVMISYVEVSG